VFDALVAELCANGFLRLGETIQRAEHRSTLPESLLPEAARIVAALEAKPFDPPSYKALAPDTAAQQVVRFYLETGELEEINRDIALTKNAFEKMSAAVAEFIRKHGPATVGELRQALGSSRRVMVPFLERLDREGVTRRAGDRRTLAR
jgi:selenocysteine-specific elongation factor